MAAPPSYAQGYAEGYAQAQAQAQTRTCQGLQTTPSPTPFALFPAFVAQKTETLVIKSKSAWTDSSYNINTIDGRPVFNISKGDRFSFSYRRRVHDANGSPIFTIKRESRVFQPTIYHALPPSETGARLFECQFDPWASGDKCTGHFANAINGQQEHFFMKGNFLQSKAIITNQASGQVLAEIKKQSFKLKTEYHIFVQPGADMALVAALCIILHDRIESHANSGGGGA
jgi:uncharacterized protein YxjI